jgi:hypothetical protein
MTAARKKRAPKKTADEVKDEANAGHTFRGDGSENDGDPDGHRFRGDGREDEDGGDDADEK